MTVQDVKSIESLSLTDNEKEAIMEFAKRLKQRFNSIIQKIILFGSKVKDKSEINSDIDILIVVENLSWEIKKTISDIASEENIKYDVLITTIRYDARKWEDPVIKTSPFGRAVREEGILL